METKQFGTVISFMVGVFVGWVSYAIRTAIWMNSVEFRKRWRKREELENE